MNAPHVERMIVEARELAARSNALTTFLEGQVFSTLEPTDQQLLRAQYASMGAYLTILNLRIARADAI
ncbi:crAss001_48 related protein [Novosphingobium sp. RL4]|uniref:crAss001_48 related protein n=1 Tax=Novosphingobium sp. RL4 TaxID=3109595 RepID=UPI002D76B1CC|nr:hypothetical protein [Novosphingobium sp. RL4]WRT91333.1 hypothetical protein U9J33_08815 [Novosphingobium sp. RL4]